MKNTRPHDVNEGFNRMFKKLLNESLIVDVDGDIKKNLKENLIKEAGDSAELELRDADYVFDEATGDIHVAEVFKYHPKFKKYIDIKFVDDNDEKIYTYKIVEYDKSEPHYPWVMEYVSEKKEFVESKKSLEESEDRILSTEEFLDWHDHKANPKNDWATLERIYNVFKENGFSEDDNVDDCYFGLGDDDRRQISAWILTKESFEESFKSNEGLKEALDPIDQYLDDIYKGGGWVTLYKIENMDLNQDDLLKGATLEDIVGRALAKGFILKETPEEGYAIVHKVFKDAKFEESLKESDKPASISIEDCQKWVDYDIKRYGKISEKTNKIIRKAGFQIIKDQYGDYEVAAGRFE